MKYLSLVIIFIFGSLFTANAQNSEHPESLEENQLSMVTDTPEAGFQMAIQLARKGVTSTQPKKEVLFMIKTRMH